MPSARPSQAAVEEDDFVEPARIHRPITLARVERALATVAELMLEDEALEPVFLRLEAELEAMRRPPLTARERAVALLSSR